MSKNKKITREYAFAPLRPVAVTRANTAGQTERPKKPTRNWKGAAHLERPPPDSALEAHTTNSTTKCDGVVTFLFADP